MEVADTSLLIMATDNDRQTSMQFCSECNNLMYPMEVKNDERPKESRLVYVCKAKNCLAESRDRDQCPESQSTMVWKHVVKHQMS